MRTVVKLFYTGLKVIIASLMVMMVCLVFGNVVLRYGFNSGISLSDEMSRWGLVWLTFLGAIVALHERQHLGVDMLVRAVPRPARIACLVVSHLLMLWTSWLLLSGSWQQAVLNRDVAGTVIPLSSGYFYYGAGVVFGVSAIPILLYELYRVLSGQAEDSDLITVAENEEETALRTFGAESADPHLASVSSSAKRG